MMIRELPLDSWHITLIFAGWLLPLLALIYPLSRWIIKYAPQCGKVILYAYPYVIVLIMLFGFLVPAVEQYRIDDGQFVLYYETLFLRFTPLMLLSNIWIYCRLRKHGR